MLSSASTPDFSQGNLLDRLSKYLTQRDGAPTEVSERLTKSSGYCTSFTTLFLYAAWIQIQPEDKTASPRDDLNWLHESLSTIALWDLNIATLSDSQKEAIERLINHLEFMQYTDTFISNSLMSNLTRLLEDSKKRLPQTEYTLGGLFTLGDLTSPRVTATGNIDASSTEGNKPLLEALIPENRLVFIRSHSHAVGIFKHDGICYFYDSNHPTSLARSSLPNNQLAEAILDAFKIEKDTTAPLAFQIYSFDDNSPQYPAQSEILRTNTAQINDAYDPLNVTGLHMATLTGCKESCAFYASFPDNLNRIETYHDAAALHLAVMLNDMETVELLIKAKVNINQQKLQSKKTPLHLAARANNIAIVNLLLENGAASNLLDSSGKYPYEYSTDPAVKLVCKAPVAEIEDALEELAADFPLPTVEDLFTSYDASEMLNQFPEEFIDSFPDLPDIESDMLVNAKTRLNGTDTGPKAVAINFPNNTASTNQLASQYTLFSRRKTTAGYIDDSAHKEPGSKRRSTTV